MTTRDLIRGKRAEILRIAAEHGARNLRVFGSAARGEDEASSDIDLLVDFDPGTSLLTHARLIVALEDLLGRKVDVAPEKSLKQRLRDRILSEALPL